MPTGPFFDAHLRRQPDDPGATPPETEDTTMNYNLVHNILNLLGLIIGTLITYDWTQLGMTAEQAAFVAGWVLIGDKIIKLAMNITRDGLGGLWKVQPPVEK